MGIGPSNAKAIQLVVCALKLSNNVWHGSDVGYVEGHTFDSVTLPVSSEVTNSPRYEARKVTSVTKLAGAVDQLECAGLVPRGRLTPLRQGVVAKWDRESRVVVPTDLSREARSRDFPEALGVPNQICVRPKTTSGIRWWSYLHSGFFQTHSSYTRSLSHLKGFPARL